VVKKLETTYLDHGLVTENGPGSPLWVIPKELCTRCGVCNVICLTDVIRLDDSEMPYIQTKGCIDCGLCLQVSLGIDFDLQKFNREMFNTDYEPRRMSGEYRKSYVGHSKIGGVRENESAGGVTTHILLGLLRAGEIAEGELRRKAHLPAMSRHEMLLLFHIVSLQLYAIYRKEKERLSVPIGFSDT